MAKPRLKSPQFPLFALVVFYERMLRSFIPLVRKFPKRYSLAQKKSSGKAQAGVIFGGRISSMQV
jgi:hypothetical protein